MAIGVQENSPISILVRKDNTILFNNRLVSLDQLPKLLQLAKEQHPKVRPQLFHDRQAHFGTYQAIKNVVEAAGFEQMDIILKPS
jgi:biopolymer transport protein ExbD